MNQNEELAEELDYGAFLSPAPTMSDVSKGLIVAVPRRSKREKRASLLELADVIEKSKKKADKITQIIEEIPPKIENPQENTNIIEENSEDNDESLEILGATWERIERNSAKTEEKEEDEIVDEEISNSEISEEFADSVDSEENSEILEENEENSIDDDIEEVAEEENEEFDETSEVEGNLETLEGGATKVAVLERVEKSFAELEEVSVLGDSEELDEIEEVKSASQEKVRENGNSDVDILSEMATERILLQRLKQERTEKEREIQRKNLVKRPLGVKLIAIVSVLMLVALGGVTFCVSFFMTKDIRISSEENNLAINGRTAASVENGINSTVSSVGMFFDMLSGAGEEEAKIRSVKSMFFERNRDIAAVFLASSQSLFTNSSFLASHEIEESTVSAYFSQEQRAIEVSQSGAFDILNASPFFSISTMALFYSTPQGVVGVLCSTDALGESFSQGTINQSFFVNSAGEVVVHGDISVMMRGEDFKENPIVKEFLSGEGNKQMTYKDSNGEEFIGAFRRLSSGGGAVITTVRTSVVLEGIRRTTVRNIFITAAILSIAIMIIYFFAKSLTGPMKLLTEIVNEINRGNFNTELFEELKVNRADEIGILAKSTRNEREILNMVSKLTNQGVTRAIIRKEIDFEPHLKDITIFFSDIRGFTAISDGFKKRFGEASAANIIQFLNDYMGRMVTCIRRTGGTVDKFEGDAIMACWGVLRHDDLSWEKLSSDSQVKIELKAEHDRYITEDALSAITCCVAMRYSLMLYNKDAEAFTKEHANEPLAQYKPHIRIGAGLNSGRATVGFMGSFEKMEFTSIGDAVNFASRTEASNKPCGTDILITEDTRALLLDYIRCEENNWQIPQENVSKEIIIEQIPVEFEVKGKGKQHFYGVVNMPLLDIKEFFGDDPSFRLEPDCLRACGPSGPRSLKELRRVLGIDEPEFEKVDLNAEENKIQVAGS